MTSLAKLPYQNSTAITGQRFVFISGKNREKGEKATDREIERLKFKGCDPPKVGTHQLANITNQA